MHNRKTLLTLSLLAAVHSLLGQSTGAAADHATPVAATAATVVPALMRYSAVALHSDGKAQTGEASLTFLVYEDEKGGDPLWAETQTVVFDPSGRYEVFLGASSSSGLPTDLFKTGEARWLEVQIAGQPTQSRTLLVSVPYAMKAADAATLGGLPASAFALAGAKMTAQSSPSATPDASASTVTTPGGTAGSLPVFSGTTTIDDSIVFESSYRIGIGTKSPASTLDVNGPVMTRGALTMASTGTATSTIARNSQPIDFVASVFDSSSKKTLSPVFTLQSEAAANNTGSPGATFHLLYGSGTPPAETGLSINNKGIIQFATGQTFPGGSGSGSITGVTAGTDLIGGGTAGTVKLGLNLSALEATLNSRYAQLSAANTFSSPVTFAVGQTFQGYSSSGNAVTGIAGGSALNAAGVYGKDGPASGIANVAAGIWGDAYQQVGVEGTSYNSVGTYGQSVNSYGVEGVSSSSNGVLGTTVGNYLNTAGVFGIAGARTSFSGIAGVWGDADAHVGVFGSSNKFSGVQGSSTTNNGVFGSSISGPGVSGSSNSGHGGQFSNASASSTVYGMNGSSSSGGAAGEFINNSSSVPAVLGTNYGATVGVYGYSPAGQGIGVEGNSVAGIGVYATTNAQSTGFQLSGFTGPVALWADSTPPNGDGEGIAVIATANGNNAGYFTNNSQYSTIYAYNYGSGNTGEVSLFNTLEAGSPNGTCGFGGNGDLACTGQVKTLVPSGGGAREVETYAMQSPENWMEDFGSATLQNGSAIVMIDPAFAETVSDRADYHVFLTPNGDSKGLYVVAKTPSGFEVRESSGGRSTLSFDYRIVAKRRGFEAQRMVDVTESMKTMKARDDVQAAHYKKIPKHRPVE